MIVGILLLGAVLLCLLAIPFIIACIPFVKFALTALLLLVVWVIGIGRVMGALDYISQTMKDTWDREVPEKAYTPPPPEPIVHRTPRRIPRPVNRRAPAADLETL